MGLQYLEPVLMEYKQENASSKTIMSVGIDNPNSMMYVGVNELIRVVEASLTK